LTHSSWAIAGFNQPKTLSGIETEKAIANREVLKASTNLKPFQGLKHFSAGLVTSAISGFNQPKTLLGWLKRSLHHERSTEFPASTNLKPFQGLKPQPLLTMGIRPSRLQPT